ncbi:MAG: YeeE/YedE family protein [Pseudomonadota bacterium]
MATTANLATTVAWWGFGLAFVFGAVANRTNFCTMGAVSDIVNMGDWGRMRMWLLAIAVAVIGANALHLAGYVDLAKSIFQTPNFTWLAYLIGGLSFGIGMTLGSGCGNKTLVRIGGGNLKSLVVFAFLGISAYMTLKGLFGSWRVAYLQPVAVALSTGQDLPSLLAGMAGTDRKTLQIALAAAISGALLIFAFMSRDFRSNPEQVIGGIVVGLLVTAGWYVTGHIGYAENPETLETVFFGTNTRAAESFSFVAPMAYSLELLMLWTDASLTVTFGIASALGVVAGSFAHAMISRSFRWEGFVSAGDTGNHIVGGILMGFGGVTALGCTVGQGISGFSTLALGSIVTFFAIIAGTVLTLKFQYWRMMRAG